MAKDSVTFPQQVRDRFSGGHALSYVCKVIDGEVTEIDDKRLQTAKWALDKLVPNPPASVITHESDKPPDFYVVHPD